MATYSSVLASRIPPTEEPGGLQSTQSPRVRHNWSNQHTITLILFYVYFSLYIKSIFKINFIMGALQCCVGFCGTEKWISYMFTYIPPFPFWITFPFRPPYLIIVLHSRFSLVIYFTHCINSVYMSIPNLSVHLSPHTLSTLVSILLFSTFVSLLLLCK